MSVKPHELCWMFLLGCFVYSLLEIGFRGFTHWTMTLTGGIVAVALYLLVATTPKRALLRRCLCGGLLITGIEFLVGVFVNLRMGWNVWDYHMLPLNLYGQICLPFTLLWCVLCLPSVLLCQWVRQCFTSSRSSEKMPELSS